MNIVNLFIESAKKYPEKPAIIDRGNSISYTDLEKDVKSTAAYFKSKGIVKGDRVLVFVPMGIDLYRIVLALFYIGAIAVFLDEWVNKKRLALCCGLADCKGFIGGAKAKVLSFFIRETRQIKVKLNLKRKLNKETSIQELPAEAPALITFTTGSTGIPKAAMRSHQFLQEQFNALLNVIKPNEADIDMPVLPIMLLFNLGIGCTSVVADFKMTKPELMNSKKILRQIKENKIDRIVASPFFIKKLAEYIVDNNIQSHEIKKIFTGGAPVFPNEASLYKKAFATSEITIVYGSTEAEPISFINAEELIRDSKNIDNGLPVGKIYEDISLKIIQIIEGEISPCTGEILEKLCVNEGEIGEIVVSGEHVLKQYFKNEEAFKQNKIVVEGTIWHRTGDSGFTKQGKLFLTGRCKQLIIMESKYLSPFIIENQLQNIEGVTTGTLLKIKDSLILVVESGLSSEWLRQRVEYIPYNEIRVLSKIPRDPRHNSKTDYDKLAQSLIEN